MQHKSLMASAVFLAASLAFAATTASASVYVVEWDPGGNIHAYQQRARELAATGTRVEIQGYCASACSFLLGNPGTCAGPDAVVRLHAARWASTIAESGQYRGEYAAAPTRSMINAYPRKLRRWIARQGGLTMDWLVLEKQELQAIVPPCGTSGTIAAKPARTPAFATAPDRNGAFLSPKDQ